MVCKKEITDSKEQLLETLIRMVGSTNQTIHNLQKRVTQLECLLREQQLNTRKEFMLKPETDSSRKQISC